MSRAKTRDEVQAEFLAQVRQLVRYWDTVKFDARDLDGKTTEQRRRLEGLAFSLLVMLDGGIGLPGFIVMPSPHPDDRSFHESEGEDFYPDPPAAVREADVCDIAGPLHELFYEEKKR